MHFSAEFSGPVARRTGSRGDSSPGLRLGDSGMVNASFDLRILVGWPRLRELVWLKGSMMRIYNLFPLLAGRFEDWPQHLERAQDLAFDWVFTNSIHYPGFSGSLYSVSDYFRWHPLLVEEGGADDPFAQFQPVRQSAQELGLRLMTDLVINHSAFDSPLVREHPEWYEWEGDAIVHPGCYENGERIEWGDLAKFSYREGAERGALVDYWLRVIGFMVEQGFSGFRCDAAYQVPVVVWEELITRAKADRPEIVFVAETLGCLPEDTVALATAGFDSVFHSGKWWDFHEPWLLDQYHQLQGKVSSIGFPESHDTPRLAEEVSGDPNLLKQRYLFTSLFAAGVLMPIGFEYGFRRPLNVVTTRASDWEEPRLDLRDFIRAVNQIRARSTTFQSDVPMERLRTENPQILVLHKRDASNGAESLLILNTDGRAHQHFACPDLYAWVGPGIRLVDVSPEFALDYLPTPFEYRLRPGQGIVLVSET